MNVKTFAVKNKGICNRLVNMGFVLLNITKNRDNPSEPCFIFERTDEFVKAFDVIQNEVMNKRSDGLTDFEKNFICDILLHKRDEYKTLGVKNIDILDSIIEKLTGTKKWKDKSDYVPVEPLFDITKHPEFKDATALMAQRNMDNMIDKIGLKA